MTHAHQELNAGFFAAQFALLNRRLQISLSGRAQTFELADPYFQYSGTTNPYTNLSPTLLPATRPSLTCFRNRIRSSGLTPGTLTARACTHGALWSGIDNDRSTGNVIFTPLPGTRDLLRIDNNPLTPASISTCLGTGCACAADHVLHPYGSANHVRLEWRRKSGNRSVWPQFRLYQRRGWNLARGGGERGGSPNSQSHDFGRLTYTNADTDQDSSVPGFYQAFDIPRHMVTLVAANQWSKRFLTTVSLFHYSSYFDAYVGYLQAYEFPGYTKTNLTASYRIWESEKKSARL